MAKAVKSDQGQWERLKRSLEKAIDSWMEEMCDGGPQWDIVGYVSDKTSHCMATAAMAVLKGSASAQEAKDAG